MLIEHYQFIEAHLETIYASIYGKRYFDGLDKVNAHSLSRLVKELKTIDSKNTDPALTPSDYERLEVLCVRRNFWVHNAYYGLPFNANTGELKKQCDIDTMNHDLAEAESMRMYLFDVQQRESNKRRASINAELAEKLDDASKALKDVIVGVTFFPNDEKH